MKKLFILLLTINLIVIYAGINTFSPRANYQNIINNIIDIKKSNDLINIYSNLIMEIVPADE
jgi:hypothetical protein